jgi:hypothetical protein
VSVVESIFDTTLDRLPLGQLLAFFSTESVETDSFESKSVAEGKLRGEEYAEDVAAFLNTNGGILVLGGPRMSWIDAGNRVLGKRFDGEATGHQAIARDALRDAILGKVEPLPVGVRFKTWPLRQGREMTAIEVPKSPYPPHQVSGRYFIRLHGATHPAPHGFVEALFRSRQRPHLVIDWQPCHLAMPDLGTDVILRGRLANRGNSTAIRPGVEIRFPDMGIEFRNALPKAERTEHHVRAWFDFDQQPIHPQQQSSRDLFLHLMNAPQASFWFEVSIFAQDMPAKYATYEVRRTQGERIMGKRRSWPVDLLEEGYIPADGSEPPYWSGAVRWDPPPEGGS